MHANISHRAQRHLRAIDDLDFFIVNAPRRAVKNKSAVVTAYSVGETEAYATRFNNHDQIGVDVPLNPQAQALLERLNRNIGSPVTTTNSFGQTFNSTVGNCAEFQALNALLNENPSLRIQDVRFTQAIVPRDRTIKNCCGLCEQMDFHTIMLDLGVSANGQ